MASISKNPLPPLSPEERAALRESIARDGVLIPVVVSAGPAMQGEIVDGFNRRAIWAELGRKPADLPMISKRFASEAEFRIAQIDANLRRRQLTLVQRVELAIAREAWEKPLAAARMKAGQPVEKSRPGSGRASAAAAEAVGLKRDTFEHARFVLEKAPSAIRREFAEGKLSVDRAYKETRRQLGIDTRTVVANAVGKRFGKLPSGRFGAIVVVPPWRVRSKGFESGRIVPAELGALDVRSIATKDAVVVVTAPARWLREALDMVLGTWGCGLVTIVARVRSSASDGAHVRERADFAIVATLGKPELPATSRDNVVESDAQLFALVDALVPEQAGIVLFGSTNRAGWDSWEPKIT